DFQSMYSTYGFAIHSCLVSLGVYPLVVAQPSDAEIIKYLKGQGAIQTRFTSEKGHIYTKPTEKYFLRTVESKWKTDWPGIYRWERSDYRYDFIGGKWVFNRGYLASNSYEGIDNPSEAEVLSHINKNIGEFLRHDYWDGIGEKPKLKLSAAPKWEWHTPNSVSFNIEYDVLRLGTGGRDVQPIHRVLRVRFYRDDGTGKHDPNIKKVLNTDWLPGGIGEDQSFLTKLGEKRELIKGELYVTFPDQDKGITLEKLKKEQEKYYRWNIGDRVTVNWDGKGEEYFDGNIERFSEERDERTGLIKRKYFVKFDKISTGSPMELEHLMAYNPDKSAAKNNVEKLVQQGNSSQQISKDQNTSENNQENKTLKDMKQNTKEANNLLKKIKIR
ncbi:MAG TPA: hypothetical protein PK110_10520, partial [Niabella sp.]|nr:hypothetical protein [Niabella sp.]